MKNKLLTIGTITVILMLSSCTAEELQPDHLQTEITTPINPIAEDTEGEIEYDEEGNPVIIKDKGWNL